MPLRRRIRTKDRTIESTYLIAGSPTKLKISVPGTMPLVIVDNLLADFARAIGDAIEDHLDRLEEESEDS